jgi:hypothetical protein
MKEHEYVQFFILEESNVTENQAQDRYVRSSRFDSVTPVDPEAEDTLEQVF